MKATQRKLTARTLLSQPVLEALKIRGADKPWQSPAMRDAYVTIKNLS